MPPDSDGAYQIREASLTDDASALPVDTGAPITISGTRRPCGTLSVTVAGELDFSNAPAFQRKIRGLLDAEQDGGLELDFSRLDFCDLAGWRAVHAVAETAAEMRHRTRITAGAPCLDVLLQLCHIPVFLDYTPPKEAL
jgi:anti-anti-sigma factor